MEALRGGTTNAIPDIDIAGQLKKDRLTSGIPYRPGTRTKQPWEQYPTDQEEEMANRIIMFTNKYILR